MLFQGWISSVKNLCFLRWTVALKKDSSIYNFFPTGKKTLQIFRGNCQMVLNNDLHQYSDANSEHAVLSLSGFYLDHLANDLFTCRIF